MDFNGLPTAISSLPFKKAAEACDIVLQYLPEIPAWPQLPAADFRENMYIQVSQNLPGLKMLENEKKIVIDTDGENDAVFEEFYENILSENVEYFSIGEGYASGLYEFVSRLKNARKSRPGIKYLKGHITGPISFGLTITDLNRKAIFYNELYRDAIIKNCSMKARWQIRFMRKQTGMEEVIIFIDEPYMTSFGSSFVSISKEDAVKSISEVVDSIHREKALAGVHCCGNTDWSVLFLTGADIISFDAYSYTESIMLYPEMLTKFFNNNGTLAWGIIPSSEEIKVEDVNTLSNKLQSGLTSLSRKGIDRDVITRNCLVTPSCGLGTLDEECAKRVMRLNMEVSSAIRSNK